MKQFISAGVFISLISCAEAPTPYQIKNGTDETANAEGAGAPDAEATPGAAEGDGAANAPSPVTTPVAQMPAAMPGATPAAMPGMTPAPEVKPVVDALSFAKELDNYRWLFPCDKEVGTDEVCDSKAGSDVTKKFAGEAGKVYDVELRFRGVVEPMKYKGGKREGEYFYIGGVADDSTYNIYSIEVSEPKQIYYVNRQDNTGHITFLIDYKAVIPVAAGATVRIVGNGQNGREIANFKKLMVPELDMTPYNGQYAQINVVSVKEKEAKK